MSWNQLTSILKRGVYSIVLCACLTGMYGCSVPNFDLPKKGLPNFDLDLPIIGELGNSLEEVSPPELIQQLKQDLSASAPVVKIIEPRENTTIDTQSIELQLSVSGLDLYKDTNLKLGPHIAIVLDDQTPLEIYDLSHPITLQKLKPGTHTIRAIAEYPWHESFKNRSAYAQRSFHILTPSHQNRVGESPVLTVSSIQDRYTAEPILLDFVVRQATPQSEGEGDRKITTPANIKVKTTLNDQTFVIGDADVSLYLEGIKDGQNWIKLELEDRQGRLQSSPFSEQLFGFQFDPEKSSPLGNIFSEEMNRKDAGRMVEHPKPVVAPPPVIVEPESIKSTPTTPIKPITPEPQVAKPTKTLAPAKYTRNPAKVDSPKPSPPTTPSLGDNQKTSVNQDRSKDPPLVKISPTEKSEAITTPQETPSASRPTQSLTIEPKSSPTQTSTNQPKANQPKANQLSDQIQSRRQSSQEKGNQGLENWRNRFPPH